MSKKPLRYFSFSTLFSALLLFCSSAFFIGCAPKVAPPPLYKDIDLSLEEIIAISQGNIKIMKAVVDINIEKNDRPYSYVNASLLLKKPNWLHMRIYKFGIMVGNFLIKDNVVYAISGKGSGKFKEFGKELYYSVFWWEDLENALMSTQGTEYIIRAANKEIRVDKSTLLPKSQKIIAGNKQIDILYDKPRKHAVPTVSEQSRADFWYPSVVKIEIGTYKFTVKVEKLFINPPLGENDFKEPGAE